MGCWHNMSLSQITMYQMTIDACNVSVMPLHSNSCRPDRRARYSHIMLQGHSSAVKYLWILIC